MDTPGNEKAEDTKERAFNPVQHKIAFSNVKLFINHFIHNKWTESWNLK